MYPSDGTRKTISHYRIEAQLGEGGAGTVYRARDTRLNRDVALKFLRHTSGEARARLIREAHAIAALRHPNIAVLHDIDESTEEPFLVFEYLPGGTLEDHASGRRVPLEELLEFARTVGAALEHAHSRGIVHRDVKPQNVLRGESGEWKLTDFGLAHIADQTTLAADGGIRGTPAYLSPEQARGEQGTAHSDQYSFGVVLYQLAAGNPPFEANNLAAMVRQILEEAPVPLASIRPDLPPWFSRAVMRLMAKRPEDRYASMAEFLAVCGVPAEPRRIPRWRIRPVASVALIVLLGLTGLWQRERLFGPRLPATRMLAVLPFDFVSASATPADADFSAGLSEMLASLLCQAEQFQQSLTVFPSSELRKNNVRSAREAWRVYRATLALEGNVYRTGTGYRVILNLIDPSVPRQLDSRIIKIRREDVGRLHELLMLRALELMRSPAPAQASQFATYAATANGPAYELTTRARALVAPGSSTAQANAAVVLLEEALRIEPEYTLAQALLAEACLRVFSATKEPSWLERAESQAQSAVRRNPRLVEAQLALGLAAQRRGRLPEAENAYKTALGMDPGNLEASRRLAVLYTNTSRFKDAEALLQAGVRARPSYWLARAELGRYYVERAELDRSIEQLQIVVQLAPGNWWGYNSLGAALILAGRLDEAAAVIDVGLEKSPTPTLEEARANLRFRRKDYAGAAADFRRLAEQSHKDSVAWGNYAEVAALVPALSQESRAAFEKAISLARESLATNPRQPDVSSRMALYLARTGQSDEARRVARKAAAEAPGLPHIQVKLARVLEISGDRAAALAALRKALKDGYSPSEIDSEPDFAGLRADPRFSALTSGSHSNTAERK